MPNTALPAEQIPQCLRDRPQCVCWKYVERDGRQTKVPVNARTGRNASATDPQTWATFQAAHDAYLRSAQLAGVGFVFTKDDPFAGVDLDNCLDEQGGFTWGEDLVARLATYTEVSQSGRGVNLFLQGTKPAFKSLGELLAEYPDLRPPVIHGLLREGESMNVRAASKVGKSWLITDLAATLATGRRWLDTFDTEPGHVLLLDNELHPQSSANRFRKVLAARRIPHGEIANRVFVENLRGRLRDIYSLAPYFEQMQPGFFEVLILDATYRFFPRGTDENSNAALADIYNQLDAYAASLAVV